MTTFDQNTIAKVAAELIGEPNQSLSRGSDVRYGNNGSLSIDTEKNTYFDHEANEGGGIIDLVCRQTDCNKSEAAKWLIERGYMEDQPTQQSRQVAAYDYIDADGVLQFQVVRFEPKTFRQRKPEGAGWSWSVKGVEQVPYRLPQLLVQPDATVYVVEGEKDADRLASIGVVATCNAGGAGKWGQVHSKHLQGRDVVILPDNDDAGRDHSTKVQKSLQGVAKSVRVLTLPGLPQKGDVSDWLDAGGTVEELAKLITSTPEQSVEDAGEEEGEKRSQTDLLVQHAKAHFELLHDSNGDVFAQDTKTGIVSRLGGRQFKDRFIAGFYEKYKLAVRDQSLREALGTLQALGRFSGDTKEVYTRVAKHGDALFVDLCRSGDCRAVEIRPGSWRVVDKPPVMFVRSESMQPLPDPIHGGSIAPLWDIANIPAPMRMMVIAWLIDALRIDTPFPGLELIGEQGSGKSTAAEALRRLIDPSSCNLRGSPKTVEDVFVCAKQNHIVAYENISHLAGPMQDALAILSTGGGYSKRQLFTDSDESIISVRRPWLINGISIAVTQQDLVDRVISIECPVIETRQSSSAQWKSFDRALPDILGGLLDIAAKALNLLPDVSLPASDRPRLVEYVLLGMAISKAMGQDQTDFVEAFKELRAETVGRTLDASPVASAVLDFVEANPSGIEASIKTILTRLEAYKPIGADAWPRSPKGLGDALRRAAPALRQLDIVCKCLGKRHGQIFWTIRQKTSTECKSPMSPKSPESARTDIHHDAPGDLGIWGTSCPTEKLDEIDAEVY